MIVTGPVGADLDTLIVKVREVTPAENFTDAGTVTPEAELEMVTTRPSVAAGPVNVTLPVEDPPGLTPAGVSFNDDNVGGFTVSVATSVLAPWLAVIVMVDCVATADVLTVNEAPLLPLGTVIDAGTDDDLLLLDSLTTIPPEGAGPFRVTVPDALVPPVTEVGFRDIEVK